MRFLNCLFIICLTITANGAIIFEPQYPLEEGMIPPGVYELSVVSSSPPETDVQISLKANSYFCLLYTSDAADE